MSYVSSPTRKKSWQGPRHRVSVLAEMALRREKVMDRLLALREQHGLSQEDAAHRVGITHRQWQRWETGESMPYPRNLDAVASRFGISITDFFDPAEDVNVDVSQLERMELKLDALLRKAKIDPADFDVTVDGVADIANAAKGSIEAFGGAAPAKPPGKRAPARKRHAG